MSRTIRHLMSRSMRRLVLKPAAQAVVDHAPLPTSMTRPVPAADLMASVRRALDDHQNREVYGGVIFLQGEELAALPTPDQARVHSAPLPAMEYFRAPFGAAARFVMRVVRKLVAPLTRRQERFNLDLLESIRKLEQRLEWQTAVCRDLQQRIAELEARNPS